MKKMSELSVISGDVTWHAERYIREGSKKYQGRNYDINRTFMKSSGGRSCLRRHLKKMRQLVKLNWEKNIPGKGTHQHDSPEATSAWRIWRATGDLYGWSRLIKRKDGRRWGQTNGKKTRAFQVIGDLGFPWEGRVVPGVLWAEGSLLWLRF